MNEGRFDALAGYGALLPLWRASAFDLPMAWAASFDIMVTEALRHQAGLTKLADCASPAEVVAEQSRYAAATLDTLAREAKALKKDVELALEPAARYPDLNPRQRLSGR
jgi:hypothetical protein